VMIPLHLIPLSLHSVTIFLPTHIVFYEAFNSLALALVILYHDRLWPFSRTSGPIAFIVVSFRLFNLALHIVSVVPGSRNASFFNTQLSKFLRRYDPETRKRKSLMNVQIVGPEPPLGPFMHPQP